MSEAVQSVRRFFDSTILLHYDMVGFRPEESYGSTDPEFWPQLHAGLQENRQILEGFIHDLRETGVDSIEDLQLLEQGYQSKVLHIVTHFVDGFIGIDSRFYNLLEDSHWVSDALQKEIKVSQGEYWLVAIEATFESRQTASLL